MQSDDRVIHYILASYLGGTLFEGGKGRRSSGLGGDFAGLSILMQKNMQKEKRHAHIYSVNNNFKKKSLAQR